VVTSFGVREHNILAAARRFDALANISAGLEEALKELTDDVTRIVMMLNSVLWTMDPGSDGWRRYAALSSMRFPRGERRPLPAVVPLRYAPAGESWPL
jgi:hypothetical protein